MRASYFRWYQMGRTYPNEIHRVLYLPGGDVGRELRRVALDIAEEAKRNVIARLGKHPGDQPRTGKLAKSFRVEVVPGSNSFIVRNPQPYAAAIEAGARRHDIKPRRVTHLRFRGRDGRWRKVKLVRHPGNAPYRYLSDARRVVMRRRYGVG